MAGVTVFFREPNLLDGALRALGVKYGNVQGGVEFDDTTGYSDGERIVRLVHAGRQFDVPLHAILMIVSQP